MITMQNKRIAMIEESFNDLQTEMIQAMKKNDRELVEYHLLRTYRLLSRMESFLDDSIQLQNVDVLEHLRHKKNHFRKTIGQWHQQMAAEYEENGEYEKAEREWKAAITFNHQDLLAYIQYAHAVLRSHYLFVSRDIQDNMEHVSKSNAYEVFISLRKAQTVLRAVVHEQGASEATTYFLNWIDLMLKALEEQKLLTFSTEDEKSYTLEQAVAELNELIGLRLVKQKITEVCDWVTFNRLRQEQGFKINEMSLHMVFSGHPGTGKTTVARIVARIFKALGVLKKGHLIEVDRSDLVAEYVGQTAVKTMKKVKEAMDGVLFVDEAYALTRMQGNDFGIEAIDTLVKAMEDYRGQLVIILAGYPNEMEHFLKANPGLHSRFKNQIYFEDYTVNELMQISQLLVKQKDYKLTEDAQNRLRTIIENKVSENSDSHGNGRLVRNIIEDAILKKASVVVYQKTVNDEPYDLDVIDDLIMRLVEASIQNNELDVSKGKLSKDRPRKGR